MRDLSRYLLILIGGPLLVVALLNVGIFGQLWKLWRIRVDPVPVVAAKEVMVVDRLVIPKISVDAPLILSQHDPTASWGDIRKDLEDGVSVAPGMGRPGETRTVWITGHSSDYSWRPGHYKTVFTLLPALSPGDQILIDYQGQRYTYVVTGNRVVRPNDVGAFVDRGDQTLTLMTCYPPLTTAKRWLTYAKLQG